MCMSDPIADMLTRVRNASARKSRKVQVPFSNLKLNLARVMEREGFIESYSLDSSEGVKKNIVLILKYHGQKSEPVCATIKRVSRPGLRVYNKWDEMPRNGFGVFIVSTSKGLMSDHDARAQHLGGEIVCSLSTVKSEN